MVYSNEITQIIPDPAYKNDYWRAKHHYKETHMHNPPLRKNRDFKAVPFGTFRGMPNYKHAEPFLLLKSLKDMQYETHNHPIRWLKSFVFGAMFGGVVGYGVYGVKP